MRATMRSSLLLPLAGLLLACAHARPAGPAATGTAAVARYFPLAVGNEWVWEDRSPRLPAERRGALRTVRILERTADGFFRDSERGELRAAGGCVQDRVRQLRCGPVAAGTTWTSVVSVGSTERYEIAAVGETITTPAGTFAGCVRVRAHNRAAAGTDLVNDISYAPGIGPVRIETTVVVDGVASPQFLGLLRSHRVVGGG
jgi:hypothetical protein